MTDNQTTGNQTIYVVMMGLSVIGLVALAWWGVGLAVSVVNLITKNVQVSES